MQTGYALTTYNKLNYTDDLLDYMFNKLGMDDIKGYEFMPPLIKKSEWDIACEIHCKNGNTYKFEFEFVWEKRNSYEMRFNYTLWNTTPIPEDEMEYNEYKKEFYGK